MSWESENEENSQLKQENSIYNDRRTELNLEFLKAICCCKSDFTSLFSEYKKYLNMLKYTKEINIEFSYHENIIRENQTHKCSKSEMYRFLVKFFDVKCPRKELEEDILKHVAENIKKREYKFLSVEDEPKDRNDKIMTKDEISAYNMDLFTQMTFNRKMAQYKLYNVNYDMGGTDCIYKEEGILYVDKNPYEKIGECDLLIYKINKKYFIRIDVGQDTFFDKIEISELLSCYENDENVYFLYIKKFTVYKMVFYTDENAEMLYKTLCNLK